MTGKGIAPVVIIGAAGGIGGEVLRQLAVHRPVIAVVLNDEQAQTARQLGATETYLCDLTDKVALQTVVESLSASVAERGISALVNCAAVQPVGACEVLSREDFEQVFAVNFFSALSFVTALLPALRQAEGRIVFFSSLLGRVASPLVGSYAASKFALEGYADSLRREIAVSGVIVTLIEPGHVNTAMATAQRELTQRAIAGLNTSHRGLYEALYRGYGDMAVRAGKNSASPSGVARVAVRAVLSRKRPKSRYLLGADAKLTVFLSWLLPSSAMDWIFRKLLNQ